MEIWIIGGILVALMIYASTKIKGASKAAYEQEVFETDSFTITKPDEFIIPFDQKSEYAFAAYSRDFGEDEAEKYRQCWATVREQTGVDEDSSVTEEDIQEDVTIKTFRKTLNRPALEKSFLLTVSVLPDHREKYADGIKLMLDSFTLK